MRHPVIIAPPASWRSATAHTVFGSCISDRILLHAGAAEAVTVRAAAALAALACARELLADHAAHRAAHEGEIHDRELAVMTADRAADHHRVAQAGRELGLGEALGVGP
jgi:hypothetical protein